MTCVTSFAPLVRPTRKGKLTITLDIETKGDLTTIAATSKPSPPRLARAVALYPDPKGNLYASDPGQTEMEFRKAPVQPVEIRRAAE